MFHMFDFSSHMIPYDTVLALESCRNKRFSFTFVYKHWNIVNCACSLCNSLSSPGLHRTEEGHQEDVCHEVHEQAKMCGAEWSEERLERAADHAEPWTSFPGQLLVSVTCFSHFECHFTLVTTTDPPTPAAVWSVDLSGSSPLRRPVNHCSHLNHLYCILCHQLDFYGDCILALKVVNVLTRAR